MTDLNPNPSRWLIEHGPPQLELLFRAVIHRQAAPVLVADDDRTSVYASAGVDELLGIPPAAIAGQKLDAFVDPSFAGQLPVLWQGVVREGRQSASLPLVSGTGGPQPVAVAAKPNVLPGRHVLSLRGLPERRGSSVQAQDYALFLLAPDGAIAGWYEGAVRTYGHTAAAAAGQPETILFPSEAGLAARCAQQRERIASGGYGGDEAWQVKQDGTLFWANSVTLALRDDSGVLQGFARVVRDFSERHRSEETAKLGRPPAPSAEPEVHIAAVVFGEYDHLTEANDSFLEIAGYGREDLTGGRLDWSRLTPPEFLPADELAHEELLRFGACTPYEKELIRSDGTRMPVTVATALLKLVPFRWVCFVQDLRARSRWEDVEQPETSEGEPVFEGMVGSSQALHRVRSLVELVAPTDATVLIVGETGTGKELVARAIHRISARRNMPFVTLNCAAIPTGLLESELFGYERGAFTGALQQKIGRFEMANRGTLFLDEVGDIPLELQPKLLRALQEKAFERLGGTRTIPIDVRLVAATNRNLTQMMADKLFRVDLFYRLQVFPINTPALRDRPGDIPLLARHFTARYARKMNKQIDKIPTETMRALVAWGWPGNIRELENFIERSVILSPGSTLRAPLDEIRPRDAATPGSDSLEQMERDHILRVLQQSDGVVTAAAVKLGMPRTTLNAMMRKLGVSRGDL